MRCTNQPPHEYVPCPGACGWLHGLNSGCHYVPGPGLMRCRGMTSGGIRDFAEGRPELNVDPRAPNIAKINTVQTLVTEAVASHGQPVDEDTLRGIMMCVLVNAIAHKVDPLALLLDCLNNAARSIDVGDIRIKVVRVARSS